MQSNIPPGPILPSKGGSKKTRRSKKRANKTRRNRK